MLPLSLADAAAVIMSHARPLRRLLATPIAFTSHARYRVIVRAGPAGSEGAACARLSGSAPPRRRQRSDRIVCVRWACLFVCLFALLRRRCPPRRVHARVRRRQPRIHQTTYNALAMRCGRALVLPGACQTTRQPASWSAATHDAERRRANMERKAKGLAERCRRAWSCAWRARTGISSTRITSRRACKLWRSAFDKVGVGHSGRMGGNAAVVGIGLLGMRPKWDRSSGNAA
jgi:hypothetical protein